MGNDDMRHPFIRWIVCVLSTGSMATLMSGVVLAQEVNPPPSRAVATAPTAFTHDSVIALAKALGAKPYAAPQKIKREGAVAIGYDGYRGLRFRPEKSIWRHDKLGFEVQLLPTGWLYDQPIALHVIEDGIAREIIAQPEMFDIADEVKDATKGMPWALSGFRINGPLNKTDINDEIVVFQGASYFRALSRGQLYGLSARGLAVGVGSSKGEEFPFFKAFWIEKPTAGADAVIVHALLDSRSVSGAYRFEITPGVPTATNVTATLFPRVELADVGLAPLTSMNVLAPLNSQRVADFRPRIHDSDGLAMETGAGERIWRPLNNPRRLQMSLFSDMGPRGFGLMQRARRYDAYLDLEAHYERRPSTWVEPVGDWGAGHVVLVEIPSEEEIHDNMVAFWKPAQPLKAGVAYTLSYRLTWPDAAPRRDAQPFILRSRAGPAFGAAGRKGLLRFVVDYAGFDLPFGDVLPAARVTSSAGAVRDVVVQPITGANAQGPGFDRSTAGTLRVAFLLDPKGQDLSELRLTLTSRDHLPAETWLYRWTKN